MIIKQLLKRHPYCNSPSYAFFVYLKLLSSIPSTYSCSDIETQLRFLCDKSNPQISEAVSLFRGSIDSDRLPSGGACNLLVHTLTRSKNYELAFSVYSRMTHVGIFPSFISLSCLVACFVNTNHAKFAPGVLGLVLKRGFQLNVYVVNLMLKGLCSNDEVEKAMELFSVMGRNCVTPDIVSYNILIHGLCKAKKIERSHRIVG